MATKKVNYLTNANLIPEIKKSKEQGKMTEELGKMLLLLVARYGTHPWYSGYTYNDEMQGEAIVHLVRVWHRFDPEKSSNAFGFYTQCIKHIFALVKAKEKRQRNIRDALIVDQGALPSYTYQEEHSRVHDEEDYEQLEYENELLELEKKIAEMDVSEYDSIADDLLEEEIRNNAK